MDWKKIGQQLHIGTILGFLIVIYLVVYLAGTVKRNYELQEQLNFLKQEISTLEAEKDALKYRIQYYQTDSYKEKEARARLGLQQPGESVVILPNKPKDQSAEKEGKKKRNSNIEQWWNFLLGRT
ncbi:MAG TPA: septum formation initiator family protein [Candidatus Dormibacteraeota bacterium]|nr:septum formation initiator family protein [Candidatus Dormibacteraeota bacterium]